MEEFILIQKVIASILVGYLLGAIPFAHIAGRLNGVDIFATGNQRAGSANVFWNISRRVGTLVFIADLAKGSLAVVTAWLLNIPDALIMVTAGAAVLGHWKSAFTRFRGGDGMATLLGITLTLVPLLAVLGIIVGFLTILLFRRSPSRSAWGVGTCYLLILGLSQYYQIERDLLLGMVILAVLVMFHNIIVRRRHTRLPLLEDEELELDLNLDLDPDSDLGPATPENR